MPSASSLALHNIGVLVTRPAHQAGPLIEKLQQAGAETIAFPTIEIRETTSANAIQEYLGRLQEYDLVIFISANAVDYGLRFMEIAGVQLNTRVAAIGQSTATRLQQQGISVDLQPAAGFNTEALLATDEMQSEHMKGKKVLIFRGEGGRELLADTLRSRGASVDYAEVYQRCMPGQDPARLIDAWQRGALQIVTVTSNEALKNLYHMLDKTGQDFLLDTPLVVPSQRCAELARQMGFRRQILTAANATDQAMVESIQQWHNSEQKTR